jgi:hypothetical protein
LLKKPELSFRAALRAAMNLHFFLGIREMQIPRFARNDSESQFFNKLLEGRSSLWASG